MSDEILQRLRAVDWTNKPEATICSQLVIPTLQLLGYGEATLHKVAEQQVYKLRDPYVDKGSRHIKLDYEPRVYEEGLWVMEAKGTDARVTPRTLGQARDYAIHPEIRAALVVTVDAAGFRVFDPWDVNWDEPLLTVEVNDVAGSIGDLRAVLGVDHVADVVRRRHCDHLRRALSASLEFGALQEAEVEFRDLLRDAEKSISAKRLQIHREAQAKWQAAHEDVLRQSGIWGVAQANNTPWIGSLGECRDFATAVLAQDERQRPTQIRQAWPAIEAVFRDRVSEGAPLKRPLWWLHVVVLGGCIRLRNEPACEPYATDAAIQGIRDSLLSFPDDPLAAASWRYQRVAIPVTARLVALMPLEELSGEARARLTPEDRIRYRMDSTWFFMHSIRMGVIQQLASVDPWTPENLDEMARELTDTLGNLPVPDRPWIGPAGDPWLESWSTTDPLLMCGLAVLNEHEQADDLLADEDEIRDAIGSASACDDAVLRRPAIPLAERLGI